MEAKQIKIINQARYHYHDTVSNILNQNFQKFTENKP